MTIRGALGVVAVAVAVALAEPAGAGAQLVSFGADLNRPANSLLTCTHNPSPAFLGILAVPPPFNESCTWTNTGSVNSISNPAASEGFLPPTGNGRLTAARVKVGPVTAPMQVVVMQAYRGAVTGCCTGVRYSPVFTPAPNAVTAVPLNLATGSSIVGDPQVDPTAVFDVVGLSVLASNVPIPAHDTGNHDINNFNNNATYGCYPALRQPDQQCVPMTNGISSNGFVVLARFDWVPSATPPPITPPGPAQPPGVVGAPPIVIATQTVPVRGGVARITFVCGPLTPCVGRVLFQSAAAAGGASAAGRARGAGRRTRTFARGRFDIPAGERGRVRAKLSRAGRRLLRRDGSRRVWVNARMNGAPVTLGRVKLERGG
jgi:hypothetical protein